MIKKGRKLTEMTKFSSVILISLISLASAQEGFVAGTNGVGNGRAARSLPSITPSAICPTIDEVASYCVNSGSCYENDQIFVCNIGTAAETPIECGPTGDNRKYCTGEPGQQRCSEKPNPSCPFERPDVCTTPGYYPDPTNCYAYYYCYVSPSDPTKILSYKIDCPVGAPFDPTGPEDRLCHIDGQCVTANCTGALDDEWRPMNYENFTNNRIAAKCDNEKATYTYVCPAGLSLDLSKLTTTCALNCTTNYQKAVDVEGPHNYYICLLGNAYLRRCPVGQKFSPEKLDCIIE